MVTRFYDATPMRMRFGVLQHLIAPHARYPWYDKETKRWIALTIDKFREQKGMRGVMRWGVLELFAQGITCHQVLNSGITNAFRVFCAPSILQRGNTSCIYAATEKASESFTVERLMALSSQLSWLVLNEIPDACKPNLRKKIAIEDKLKGCKNVLHVGCTCMAHQVHRIVEKNERWSIGNIHAIWFSASQACMQNLLQMALWRFLKKVQVVPGSPPEKFARRNRAIMMAVWPLDDDGKLPVEAEQFLAIFNGDWTLPVPVHYCDGCCTTLSETVDRLFGAVVHLDVLQSSGIRAPSLDDWGSAQSASARTTVGLLVHNLLGICFERGCLSWDELEHVDMEQDNEDLDDLAAHRLKVQKKVYRSQCVLKNDEQRLRIVLLSLLGQSLQILMMWLQKLDLETTPEKRGLLRIQLENDQNPFIKCRRKITAMIRNSREDALGALY